MSRRQARPARRLLSLEPLEARALLAAGTTSTADFFVRFKATATVAQEAAAVAAVGGTTAATYPGGPTLVRVADPADVAGAVAGLRSSPLVDYAEADATVRAASIYPNDPAFAYSWGLNNANDVDIDAPEAWSLATGSPAIIVAVLDSGIDLANPDFAGRVLPGYNFVNNTTNVQDDDGHGTHVSSLIAAAGNDGGGTVGVACNVRILPLKFLDANGNGYTSDAVSAIYYAVDHGARVINASWGGFQPTQALHDAISYANAHNVVFVTAAGNEGTNNDVTPSYPASYHLPNELSVTAVDQNGALPYFSNYGPTTVDIAAPGVSIVGDWPTSLAPGGFQVESGTSMSTAYVSGVVALLASIHPEFTAAQLVQHIDASAKPLASMAGKTISGGMVDAYRALVSSGSPVAVTTLSGLPALAPGAMNDAQIQSFVLATDEFFASQGGTGPGFIAGLYNKLLGRAPDPGGFAYWLGLYNQGTTTRYNIALAIATSPEAYATEIAGWYQADLGRPPVDRRPEGRRRRAVMGRGDAGRPQRRDGGERHPRLARVLPGPRCQPRPARGRLVSERPGPERRPGRRERLGRPAPGRPGADDRGPHPPERPRGEGDAGRPVVRRLPRPEPIAGRPEARPGRLLSGHRPPVDLTPGRRGRRLTPGSPPRRRGPAGGPSRGSARRAP